MGSFAAAFIAFLSLSMAGNFNTVMDLTSLSPMGDMTMSMHISDSEDRITITVNGPSAVYYAIGIGSCTMTNTYAIIIPGLTASDGSAPFEVQLGTHKGGDVLDSSFDILEDTTSGLLRSVTFSRSLSHILPTDSYYSFSTEDDTLKVMYAYGSSADYSYHGAEQKGCATLAYSTTLQNEHRGQREQRLVHVHIDELYVTFIHSALW